jgi:DNA-directed RNA polymerase beta' subunit
MDDIKEIQEIIFGIFSAKEIIDISVCKIDTTKLTGSGTVYDPRMGCDAETNLPCVTCNASPKECPGHFGHIELNEYIIHPLFYKQVVSFLRCCCIQCNRLLITEDQVSICGLMRYKHERRFKKIMEKLEKVDICCHCSHPQPKITYSISDNTIAMVYKEKVTEDDNQGDDSDPESSKKNIQKKKETKISIALSVDEIKKLLDAIPDSDVILCGFDPENVRPGNFIMSVFPVIPPCARPFVLADGNICDDDLTNQILEIIKANNILKPNDDEIPDEKKENKKQKALQSLKFRVTTFYNNSQGKAKHPTNGRPIKGLKERMTGKEGQIRNNLMGKRVEFSGRTVIGPDPKLRFGEMGLPIQVSQDLTIPEMVTSFNYDYLSDIVNTGKANFIIKNGGSTRINLKYAMYRKGTELLYGDTVLRGKQELKVTNGNIILQTGDNILRNGKVLKSLQTGDVIIRKGERLPIRDNIYLRFGDQVERNGEKIQYSSVLTYPSKKRILLNIGDEVHRHLKDGDIVLLNRQPTLHKGSMLAKRIRILPGKTFRMNLATTKTFNADFDGDEMNIHVPQGLESRAELEYLSATKHNIISAQASKPNIAIVQDSLLAAFLMTKENLQITKIQFFDISLSGEMNGKTLWCPDRINTIKKILTMKGKKPIVYNGRGLISLLLPPDFLYEKKNGAHPSEPIVKIFRGVMYEGALDKNILGTSHNSIIQTLHKEYGIEIVSEFISNIQFITNNWLLVNGFSVGLEDCLITSADNVVKIQDKISKCYVEAEGIIATTHNPGIREVRITAALSKAKDVGMKIAKDSMSSNNNLLSTVHSGSKGDFFNIAQLTGLLGQQNLLGQRVPPTLNHGKRTLPHYPFEKMEMEDEYESRGFIRHSFIEGLNPQEYFFHAMSGREGICDTAMGTAKSGYIQRRIIKVCEDIQVKYDGTVRDTTGNVYQMSYGDNGMDPSRTVKVGKTQMSCDISRMVDRLNLQHDIKKEDNDITTPIDLPIKKVELPIKKVELPIKKVELPTKSLSLNSKVSRVSLLRSIAKKTGKKNMYKGWSINELTQRLDALELE